MSATTGSARHRLIRPVVLDQHIGNVALNLLAGPRALVRERDHQKKCDHILNG